MKNMSSQPDESGRGLETDLEKVTSIYDIF